MIPVEITPRLLARHLRRALIAHGCDETRASQALDRCRRETICTPDEVVTLLCNVAAWALPRDPDNADAAARNAAMATADAVPDSFLDAWTRALSAAFSRRLRPGESWCPACGGRGQRLLPVIDGDGFELIDCTEPRCVGGRVR